jgi:hypothetical protein
MTDNNQYDDDELITSLDSDSQDDEPQEQVDQPEAKQAKRDEEKQSRFQKRINQFNREKKEALERAAQFQKEVEELRAQLAETQKVKSENDTAYLKSALSQALAANDYERAAEITTALSKINHVVEPTKPAEPKKVEQSQYDDTTDAEIPEAFYEYATANADWVGKDADKTAKADSIISQLAVSGFKVDDPATFILLDVNLETDDGIFDKSLTKKAAGILKRLNDAGFSNDDPKIKALLKTNLKKMNAQPQPERSAPVSGGTKNTRISDTDKQMMKQLNLDPNNAVHVEEWIKARAA